MLTGYTTAYTPAARREAATAVLVWGGMPNQLERAVFGCDPKGVPG